MSLIVFFVSWSRKQVARKTDDIFFFSAWTAPPGLQRAQQSSNSVRCDMKWLSKPPAQQCHEHNRSLDTLVWGRSWISQTNGYMLKRKMSCFKTEKSSTSDASWGLVVVLDTMSHGVGERPFCFFCWKRSWRTTDANQLSLSRKPFQVWKNADQ